MSLDVGKGICVEVRPDTMRTAICADNSQWDFTEHPMPQSDRSFYMTLARTFLTAAEEGSSWAVVSIPEEQNANLPGAGLYAEDGAYELRERCSSVNKTCGFLFGLGFETVVVSDTELSTMAVTLGMKDGYYKAGALLLGTDLRCGVAELDEGAGVFRMSRSQPEPGLLPYDSSPLITFDDVISGKAIKARTGVEAVEVDEADPVWQNVGSGVGRIAMTLAVTEGIQWLKVAGDVGETGYPKFRRYIDDYLGAIAAHGNKAQKAAIPRVGGVLKGHIHRDSMFGAVPVMQDRLTRIAV